MTALEPRIRRSAAPAYAIATTLPERLRSWPTPHRPWLREAIDVVTMGVNRVMGDTAWATALHRRALARMEYPEIPFAMPARPGLAGLRIAFLTDLHVGSYLREEDLAAVFAEVARREPDLVLFGGDLINSREDELAMLERPLKLLRPRLGCFAVPGNHDHRWHSDMGRWHDDLQAWGVTVLNNHGIRLGDGDDSMWLCGVDDLTDGRPDMRRALWGRAPGEPTILIAHQPDHFIEAARRGVDLTLSGHTHGGQVRLFGWAPVTHSKHGLAAGWFERGGSRLYVSRGVGATVLPLRTGVPPEVPILRVVGA